MRANPATTVKGIAWTLVALALESSALAAEDWTTFQPRQEPAAAAPAKPAAAPAPSRAPVVPAPPPAAAAPVAGNSAPVASAPAPAAAPLPLPPPPLLPPVTTSAIDTGLDAHSPSTAGAPIDALSNARLTNGLSGATGLLQLSSADLGRSGVFRLSLFGEYFSSQDFPVLNAKNTRTVGTFALGYTFVDFLEGYLSYSSSANTNNRTSPSLMQAQGDIALGLKAGTEVTTGLSLGAELQLALLPGVGGQAASKYAFGVAPRLLVTYDVRRAAPRVPLRFHLNVGGIVDRSAKLVSDHELTASEEFALRIHQYNRATVGLGVEAPLPYVTPFLEWNLAYPLGTKGPLMGPDGNRVTVASSAPQTLGLGLKLTAIRDFSLLAGVQVGLARYVALGVPATPPYNVFLGLAYNFAPGHQVTKVVEKTTFLEKRVEVPVTPPKTTGQVAGAVLDAKTQKPIPGALVVVTGAGLPPVAADAEQGRFLSYDLPAGPVSLQISSPGYKTVTLDALVEVGKVASLQALLIPEITEATVKVGLSSDRKPVAGRILLEGPKKTELAAGQDGLAKAQLPKGHYLATVDAQGYLTKLREFDVPESGELQVDIELSPLPKVPLVAVKNDRIQIKQQVHFATGKAEILPDSDQLLEQVVDAIVRNNIKRIRVEGHTDNRGSKAANQKLSADRAQAVVDYLVKKGIDPSRLTAQGFGDSRPVAPNLTARGRNLNRRVELIILER